MDQVLLFPDTASAPERKNAVDAFFDSQIKGKKILTGGEYIGLFRAAAEQGFTDAELKKYLSENSTQVQSSQPPLEVRNTTYDNRSID